MTVPDTVLGMIGAAVLDVSVFDGSVPTEPPERYAVFYPDIGTLDALTVCGTSDSAVFRFQVTSVAPDRAMAAWIAAHIRDDIVDARPSVDGWECGPIRHTYSMLPQRDESVMEHHVVYAVDQYALLTTRADSESSSS